MSDRDVAIAAFVRELGASLGRLADALSTPVDIEPESAAPRTGPAGYASWPWPTARIKAELRMRGLTLRALSLKSGLAKNTCRDALRHPMPRAEKAIADAIGVPPSEIWPARYGRAQPQTRGWDPERIKAEVYLRGTTLSALSRSGGLCEGACKRALIQPWPRAEKILSDFLGVPVKDLFPDRRACRGGEWTRTRIKLAVHEKGTTLRALAVTNGLHRNACIQALVVPSPRACRAIAECIGVPVEELWPARYATKKEAP